MIKFYSMDNILLSKLQKIYEEVTAIMDTEPLYTVDEKPLTCDKPKRNTEGCKEKEISEGSFLQSREINDPKLSRNEMEDALRHGIGRNISRLAKYKKSEKFRNALINQEASMFDLIGVDKETFDYICKRREFTPDEVLKLVKRINSLGIDCREILN